MTEGEQDFIMATLGYIIEQVENHQVTGDEECPFCMGEMIAEEDIKEFKEIKEYHNE